MEFFILNYSLDLKEVGVENQIQNIAPDYNPEAEYSWRHIKPQEPINYRFRAPNFILEPKAIMTDFLNFVPGPRFMLLISDKFFDLMKGFHLPEFQKFTSKVFYEGKDFNYNLVYFSNSFDSKFIDFKQSKFAITKFGKFVESIIISSEDDFWRKKETIKRPLRISFVSLILKEEIQFDLFRLYYPFTGFFISSKLKNSILANNITGIKIYDLNSIRPLVPKAGGGFEKMEIPVKN